MKDTFFYKYIAKPFVWFWFTLLFGCKVVGKENIPKNGRVVLAGNHTNYLDSLMLISIVPRQVHFLAKDSLFKGFVGFFLRGVGGIPVNRKIHDKDALISAKKTLEMDLCIGIFPEGTINRTDDIIMPFKIGAVKMSHDTDSTLVPFIITGEYKWFRRNTRIEFFPGYKIKSDDLTKENEKLMKKISRELEKNK